MDFDRRPLAWVNCCVNPALALREISMKDFRETSLAYPGLDELWMTEEERM